MKKIILFLLINALLFPLCTTVQGKKKKVRKEEKTVVLQLTEEQQRKYDYFFLEAIRMKEKKEYATAFGLLQHCLPFMKFLNIICFSVRYLRDRLL